MGRPTTRQQPAGALRTGMNNPMNRGSTPPASQPQNPWRYQPMPPATGFPKTPYEAAKGAYNPALGNYQPSMQEHNGGWSDLQKAKPQQPMNWNVGGPMPTNPGSFLGNMGARQPTGQMQSPAYMQALAAGLRR